MGFILNCILFVVGFGIGYYLSKPNKQAKDNSTYYDYSTEPKKQTDKKTKPKNKSGNWYKLRY